MTIRVIALALFVLGVAVVTGALYLGALQGFSVEAFEETIRSWGAWSVVASIVLMIVHSFVPFPAEFLAVANGMVFGTLGGIAVTWCGAMLGGFLAFGVVRVLGRPYVDVMISRRDWHVVDDWTAARGGRLLLVSRFIPVIAFNLINYAAGLSRISWWTFTWATGIGILPMTGLMVVMGDNIEVLTWEIWLLLGAGGIVLWLVLWAKFQASRRRAGAPLSEPERAPRAGE